MSEEEDRKDSQRTTLPWERSDFYEILAKQQKEYRWKKVLARFREFCPLAWFLDEYPTERMYLSTLRRPTLHEARYHWFRFHTGWTFLAKLRNESGVKFAAAAGLASALFQASPDLQKISSLAGPPFLLLFLSGVAYLGAAVWLSIFCPQLLRYSLYSASEKQGNLGRMWLLSLVQKEFLWWWQVRPWRPDPILHTTHRDQNAHLLSSFYGPTGMCGFGSYAQAHIEQALFEFSQAREISIWRGDGAGQPFSRFWPGRGYDGNRPSIFSLSITRVDEFAMEQQSELMLNDLIIDWSDAPVTLLDSLPREKSADVSRYAQGLSHLFDTDASAFAFAEIVGRWQDSRRPVARLGLLALYCASAGFFCLFVWFQTINVVRTLGG